MKVQGLAWLGTRTARFDALTGFYEGVLGLAPTVSEAGFRVYRLPDGRNVEVFDETDPEKRHFTTGPVVGFAVDDLPAAIEELRAAGVELLGAPAPTWQHFRGPDGNVYELVAG